MSSEPHEYPQTSPEDELQAATGEGFDPDQTWDDEPIDDFDDDGVELIDPEDAPPKQAVIEE